jgi:predicted ATPase
VVAQSIEAVHADALEPHYAALAIHTREGEVWDKALTYLGQAAAQAMTRSAYAQAVEFLGQALDLLRTKPAIPDRLRRELEIQTSLGRALMSTKGYAAPEVERAYARARELCRELGDGPQLYPVIQGLWLFHFVRADLDGAHALARQLLRQARDAQDPGLVMEAYRALGTTLCFAGHPGSARTHLEDGTALYDPDRHRSHALRYGQDSGVTLLSYLAWVLWLLGYPDAALKRTEDALSLAHRLGHPFTLAFALNWAACVHRFRRDQVATRATAEAVIRVAAEHGFAQRVATGTMLLGWASSVDARDRIDQIREGLRAFEATGARIGRQHYLALLAEAYAEAGRPDEARAVIGQALELVQRCGERMYEAELYRLDGEFLLAESAGAVDRAARSFLTAIEVAAAQRAKSLELRATTSLARLLERHGKPEEARSMLENAHAWFTEGLDTADLRDVRAILGGPLET